ncbi:MAG: cellulase family glycosylhydrolase [Nitrospirota bacterium]
MVDAGGAAVMLRGFNVELKHFAPSWSVLGENDIRKMAAAGANCLRLVLDYRQFEPAPFSYDARSFALLDRVLGWCERHGLYAILDMHLAPGMQNTHDFVVHREGRASFWSSEAYQERFYALWEEIARRYAGRTVVAGYDLLNEGTPPSAEDYRRIIGTAAERIRRLDKRHMLIVEEAILEGWRKELVGLDDPNILYSIHFFYPPRFAFYITTTDRPVSRYPGEMVSAGKKIGEARSSPLPPGRSERERGEWRQLRLTATPPEGADIVVVSIESPGGSGTVLVDDVELLVNGVPAELPAPLVANGSFEIDYPGFHWTLQGSCISVERGPARTGAYALSFYRCAGSAAARSSPMPVKRGSYELAAWYRAEGADDDMRIVLAWHEREVVARIDRQEIERQLAYALDFKTRHKAPLFVGEFTAHANPSLESIVNYLTDFLEIMEREGLHWTFWNYYSEYPGVGIFTGDPLHCANPAAWETLGRFLKRGRREKAGSTVDYVTPLTKS